MATHTTHYNLIKPALNDKVNINDFNDNADKIDTALYGKVNTSDTENIITSANNCMLSDGVTSVADALEYSTTEHVVGKWIDGSDLYEKVINFGALPNNSTKNVAHGISNLGKVIEISGFARNSSTNTFLPLSTASNNYIIPFANSTEVGITAGADRTTYDECYFILRYTKNN